MSALNTPLKNSPSSNKSPWSGEQRTGTGTPSKNGGSPKTGNTPKSGGSSKTGTPSKLSETQMFDTIVPPEVSIIEGCQRTVVEAQKLGLDVQETQGHIATALTFILDKGKDDVDAAINNIKARAAEVGENTVQGIILTGVLRCFEESGGFAEPFQYSIHTIDGQRKKYAEKAKVVPRLSGNEGMDFAPGSTWGN